VYKLVAVGGKLRGQEIILNEGENSIGRGSDCDHVLNINGVSKKHMSITVNGETCFVEDLGSSNGTFVNGKLVKKATVKDKDKIAIPNVIFQVVYVKEKKVVVKKQVVKAAEDNGQGGYDKEVMPNDLFGKLKFIFKNKIMSVIYSFNEQYEWAQLLAILLFIFIATSIGLTIGPVLLASKKLLVTEIASRGTQYAKEVSRFNAIALKRGNLDRINTTFLDNDAEGVVSYELFDLEGRIVRPMEKLNSYISDAYSVDARDYFRNVENLANSYIKKLGDGEIGISRAITSHNMQTGQQESVGVIAIRFKPESLAVATAQDSIAYLESLIITCMIAVFFFGMVYYMTIKPIDEMRMQVEDVLRGKKKELDSPHLFRELSPLRSTINSILQRIRELQNQDTGEFAEIEEDAPYVRRLYEFLQGAQGAAIVLNSEKLIEHINPQGEDLTGLRESTAQGTSLLDSARDQGFAATVIDLCDQSANNEGTAQSEIYELTGKNFRVNVVALMGKDKFAKAFYITFVLDD
jgi:nitrogen fixation/metabolism regulation signal transduction histidine kinase